MGHLDGSVQARYSDMLTSMRTRLCDELTGVRDTSLDARLELCSTSPVRVLNELLSVRAG